MKFLILPLLLILTISCNKSGGGAFEDLEDDVVDQAPALGEVKIKTFTPQIDPLNLSASTPETTFAVSVYDGAGEVTYDFNLDGAIVQSSEAPFYILDGAALSAGIHTLNVTAKNSINSDSHTFNIDKNNPPTVVSSTPVFTGSLLNCNQDSLTFSAVFSDVDADTLTTTWLLDSVPVTGTTPFTVVSQTASSAQLVYTPDCSVAGFHSLTMQVSDGSDVTTQTWSYSVVNPAVETITAYFPTSNNITYLSTDISKFFSASGSGVGSLTFTWKLDGVTVQTTAGAVSSNFTLNANTMVTGNHTLKVVLTDSSAVNDPASPVEREWSIYKNEKPRFLVPSPNAAKLISTTTAQSLTANVEDALDTFVITISKDSTNCSPFSNCNLSSVSLPTTTGPFSAIFTPGSTFLGQNIITLKATDSHGEETLQTYSISANYFSNKCNDLSGGQICTIAGLPGLGSNLSQTADFTRIRMRPRAIVPHKTSAGADSGGFFITDDYTHTVWFYNSTTSTISNVIGKNIGPKKVVAIFGRGANGASTSGQYNDFLMSLPFGMAFDYINNELYVGDYNNSRIIRFDSSGEGSVFASGASITDGAAANTHKCNNPSDLAMDMTNNRIFAMCVGNTTAHEGHVKYFNTPYEPTNPSKGYTVVRYNATPANGTLGAAGTGRTRQLIRMAKHPAKNVIFAIDNNGAQTKPVALNMDTAELYYSATPGTLSVPTNEVRQLTLNANGSLSYNKEWDDTTLGLRGDGGLAVFYQGGVLKGLFLSSATDHRVLFLNLSASTVTVGNQTVPSGVLNQVVGTGTADYSRAKPAASATLLSGPQGVYSDGSKLFIADYNNARIASVDVSVANGDVSDLVGNKLPYGYDGESSQSANNVRLNQPFSLKYKADTNELYFYESVFPRIRALNLTTGEIKTKYGTGAAGDANSNPESSATVAFRRVNDMDIAGSEQVLVYSDSNFPGTGTLRNCVVRMINQKPDGTPDNDYPWGPSGNIIYEGLLSTILGNYGNGCGPWVDGQISTAATLNNPSGVSILDNASEIVMTAQAANCLVRYDDSGVVMDKIGSCNAAGADASGSFSAARFNAPSDLEQDPLNETLGNVFVIDRTGIAGSYLKYVNFHPTNVIDFPGPNVGALSVGKLLTSDPSEAWNAVAAFEDQVCVSSGWGSIATTTPHNVTCYDRSSGAGLTKTIHIGSYPTDAVKGGTQVETEDEGVAADEALLAQPRGLAFDGEGNLYIADYLSGTIKKVKRWF